jgi:hypothetical protein
MMKRSEDDATAIILIGGPAARKREINNLTKSFCTKST